MEVGKDTKFSLTIETAISIVVTLGMVIGMWFTLKADIEEAKQLPEAEITEIEFSLKDEMIRNEILNQGKQLEQILQRIERIENKVYE